MKKISALLASGKVLVSDGAWGTFLHEKGLRPEECPEEWNLTHPEDVFDIAKSYIDAGADMIETNSFGGSILKLNNYNLGDKVLAINEAAAAISRKAAGEKIVIGSIGPSGKILMMGEVTEEDLYDSFKNQASALEKGGADAVVIETMTDIEEAKIAVRAAKENTSLEIICTMTFDQTATGDFFTMMGVSPSVMISEMRNLGVDIIGSNCGNGIDGMIDITKKMREIDATIPILIQANAGMPIYKDGKTVFPETPEQLAGKIPELIKAGANIIGGCCGTTPEHIKKISEIISGY